MAGTAPGSCRGPATPRAAALHNTGNQQLATGGWGEAQLFAAAALHLARAGLSRPGERPAWRARVARQLRWQWGSRGARGTSPALQPTQNRSDCRLPTAAPGRTRLTPGSRGAYGRRPPRLPHSSSASILHSPAPFPRLLPPPPPAHLTSPSVPPCSPALPSSSWPWPPWPCPPRLQAGDGTAYSGAHPGLDRVARAASLCATCCTWRDSRPGCGHPDLAAHASPRQPGQQPGPACGCPGSPARPWGAMQAPRPTAPSTNPDMPVLAPALTPSFPSLSPRSCRRGREEQDRQELLRLRGARRQVVSAGRRPPLATHAILRPPAPLCTSVEAPLCQPCRPRPPLPPLF